MSNNVPTEDITIPIEITSTDHEGSSEQDTTSFDVEDPKADGGKIDTENRKLKPFILLTAVCAALGGLLFGYDIAGAGATFVMQGFEQHFHWSCPEGAVDCVPYSQERIDRQQGAINGLFGAGATVGAILNPYVADKYGRRKCLFLAGFIFILGATIQTASPTMGVMLAGRFIAGSAIGSLSMCVPIYITECSPDIYRGALGTLWQLAITFGILIASAANLGLKEWDQGWRLSYGGNILFAIMLVVCLIFMPESPRWLAANGTEEALQSALEKLRYEDEIESEKLLLAQEVKQEKNLGVSSWKDLLQVENKMRYRLFLGVGLQATQQLSGINAIMFYSPKILDYFFGSDGAIYGTFALNFINFISTFITVFAIDRVGRVKLMVSGGFIMCLSLLANSILSAQARNNTTGALVIVFCAMYIVGFAYSWGPVVWVVCSEMFPLRGRGKATGVTTMTNWMMTTIIGALFPRAATASLSGCFGFFAVTIFLGSWMVYLFEPETKNRTTLQIDQDFADHKVKLHRKKW